MSAIEISNVSELDALFSSLLYNVKSGSTIWDDVVNKGGKLFSALRVAVCALNSFLDAIQKLADLACKTTGGSKEIGASLTRLCMRQKRLGVKVKTMNNQLITCMVNPISSCLDEWKRKLSNIDKQHSREAKHTRADLKRAVSEAKRIQRKVSKLENSKLNSGIKNANMGGGIGIGIGVGEPPSANRAFVQKNNTLLSNEAKSLAVKLEAANLEIKEKLRKVEDVERSSIRTLMLEERSRYCFFFNCIKPALESESSMLEEISTLHDLLSTLTIATKDPSQLMEDTEAILARVGIRSGGGSAGKQNVRHTSGSLSAPVLEFGTNEVDAFAAAVATIFSDRQHHQKQHNNADNFFEESIDPNSTTSSDSSSILPHHLNSTLKQGNQSVVDQNSISECGGSLNSERLAGNLRTDNNGNFVYAYNENQHQLINNNNGSLNSSQTSVQNSIHGQCVNLPTHQMSEFVCSQKFPNSAMRSLSSTRETNHQRSISNGNEVIMRQFNKKSAEPEVIVKPSSSRTRTMIETTANNEDELQISSTPAQCSSVFGETSYNSLQRYSTATLQLSTNSFNPHVKTNSPTPNDIDDYDEEVTAESDYEEAENNTTDATKISTTCERDNEMMTTDNNLKFTRHTISSAYECELTNPKRTPLSTLYKDNQSKSKTGDSNAILYPNQALPPPEYTNLNQLTHAAQRKFSMFLASSGASEISSTNSCAILRPPSVSTFPPNFQVRNSINLAANNQKSDDTASIASAPFLHQPLTHLNGVAIRNNTLSRKSALLYSAPSSPKHHENSSNKLTADRIQRLQNSIDLSNSLKSNPHPHGSIASSVDAEDPFSVGMDELDRMVAAIATLFVNSNPSSGSSGTSSVNTSQPNSLSHDRPVSHHSVVTCSNNGYVDLPYLPSDIRHGPNKQCNRVNCKHHDNKQTRTVSVDRSCLASSMSTHYFPITTGTISSNEYTTGVHAFPTTSAFTADKINRKLMPPPKSAQSSKYIPSDNSSKQCKTSDSIDKESEIASTTAGLLYQLSGQLQQMNSVVSKPHLVEVTSSDNNFDLPAPPSPDMLGNY